MLFGSALPQVLATNAKNLLLLAYGMTIGFPTILIPQVADYRNSTLHGGEEDLRLSLEEISWISSINLLTVPLGCLLSGRLTQPFGRKKSMICLNVPLGIAWVVYYFSDSAGMLYLALSITGLAGGLLEAPVLTYVAEITEPQFRGFLSATASMGVILGVFIQFLLGSVYPWRTVALINIAIPILAIIAIAQVPESPHWLLGQGRVEDAKKSLCWLRGWVDEKDVAMELGHLQEVLTNKEQPKKSWAPYLKRSFFHPYFLVCYVFFIGHFGGMTTLQTFAVGMFKEVGSPLDEYKATVILGLVQLVGALVCVCLVKFTGRRKLAVSTSMVAGIVFILVGAGNFYEFGRGHFSLYGLLLTAFFTHSAIRLLPWMLIGEVYPAEVRGTASGLSGGTGYLMGFAANKSYIYLHSWLGLPGTLTLYGCISCLGALGTIAFLPETEGKSLAEVGKIFEGKENPAFKDESKL
ncbi:unnamed protein product [Nezara viridula]|uniref:Major facilitator superfamily (MFS) profile domain-containing protein n=1 Tax=Nezara viridula TaxID=85310 RepID=A0A9P0H4W5_NEZVI|nr:unnamed protein product [Nezara viridula]